MLYALVFGAMWGGLATFATKKNYTKVQAWLGGLLVATLLMAPAMILISTIESLFIPISSLESAKSFVLGTWVYDENTSGQDKYPEWEKLVISDDNTLTREKAFPSESQWRDKEVKNYKVFMGKYNDTGEKYFALTTDEYQPNESYIIDGSHLN